MIVLQIIVFSAPRLINEQHSCKHFAKIRPKENGKRFLETTAFHYSTTTAFFARRKYRRAVYFCSKEQIPLFLIFIFTIDKKSCRRKYISPYDSECISRHIVLGGDLNASQFVVYNCSWAASFAFMRQMSHADWTAVVPYLLIP